MSVTLAGIADDTCDDCDGYNGTYLLEVTGTCVLEESVTPRCGEASVSVRLEIQSGVLEGRFTQLMGVGQSRVTYFSTALTPILCLELDELDIPFFGTFNSGSPSTYCDHSSMTYTVTSSECP